MKSKYSYMQPLSPDAPEKAHYERLAHNTRVPPHAHVLISTYFENWPCEETQAAYKAAGLRAHQYWLGELRRIFSSCLEITDEFRTLPFLDYYVNKYASGGSENDPIIIAKMNRQDQIDIYRAFITQLGMHWDIFPVPLEDALAS